MDVSKTNEQAFEELIEKALVGSTREEREASGDTDIDAQTPDTDKYYWGKPSDFDKKFGLDLRRLWSFLKATQQNVIDEYKGGDLTTVLPKQLHKNIQNYGVIKVLRNGLDINDLHFSLFYPKPSAADSQASHEKYLQNQFSVTRQATFSVLNPGLEIDMVVYINGIPLFTFELKNPWTHQTAKYDGQKQYKSNERNPKETLLNYARCLAHFTLDKNEVYFTTRLNGELTHFMPFNKGLENGQGAGNPVNSNGYKTAYLWEDILRKDIVADIIMNYVLLDFERGVTRILKNSKKLIFPRFHQLDVVNKLLADVAKVGVGKTYLIQHSAGSGKSNSLTWLAYKLIKLTPNSMYAVRAKALDLTLFDSVIVVTDRTILDRQLTDNIKAFGQSTKIVAHADSSKDLKNAIVAGKKIIITTIQKFPFICDSICDVSDRNFAIIIDEAHSSQSGIAADKMNTAVQKDADTEEGDTDALLEKLMKDRKMSTNCSYFAFTATPKKETLERFGTKDSEGKFHPFHLYSMKQAIEEGFILDVLNSYTTYRSYYEMIKSTEDNPEFNEEKAQKLLKRAVEREPRTIEAKAEVILSHFDANVYRNHRLRGKGKAMVLTKDIECAILYYQALCEICQQKELPYKILVAFSDTKKLNGQEYTEALLNGFPENQTAEKFDTDEYRILVVANKYLTGFDQPKLCAMYIDKPLDGVLAVQALSRLNRAAPNLGKVNEDLFIVDFYNTLEGINKAFEPFYTASTLSETTDVNVLHDLKNTLLDIGVFDMDEVNDFIELFVHGAEASEWAPIIDTCVERFDNEIEWPENGKADFKMKCKQFLKVYSKMAAIMEFNVKDWEKLYWFFRILVPELRVNDNGTTGVSDLLDYVDLNTYGLRRTALNETIRLNADETIVAPNRPVMVNAGDNNDDPNAEVDRILQDFNERWFRGWDATPDDQKAKLISITQAVSEDEEYKDFVVGNPDQDAANQKLVEIIDKVIRKKRKGETSLYKEYQQNEGFKSNFRRLIGRMLDNLDYMVTPEKTSIPSNLNELGMVADSYRQHNASTAPQQ